MQRGTSTDIRDDERTRGTCTAIHSSSFNQAVELMAVAVNVSTEGSQAAYGHIIVRGHCETVKQCTAPSRCEPQPRSARPMSALHLH